MIETIINREKGEYIGIFTTPGILPIADASFLRNLSCSEHSASRKISHFPLPEFSVRPQKSLNREDFDNLLEYEVEKIVAECWKKGQNGRRILQYLMCFKGYSEYYDEWLTGNQLKNAPKPLEIWRRSKEIQRMSQKVSATVSTAFQSHHFHSIY